MNSERQQEIHQLVYACHQTGSTDLEAEKTAVIAELLAEAEQSDKVRRALAIVSNRCEFSTAGLDSSGVARP